MAITVYTEDQVRAIWNAAAQTAYPGKGIGPTAFLGQTGEALSQLVAAIQLAIGNADRDGVPASEVIDGVLRSRSSTAALDQWAITFALASNTAAGAFGRNGAVAATGGGGTVVGAAGTVVNAGSLLADPSGQVQVELVSGLTIPVGGSIAGAFQAALAGSAGNLPVGTVLTWLSPPAGLAPRVTLTTKLSGGYDVESDLDLLLRLLRRLQAPPHGGTAADWRAWAEAATDAAGRSLGIARAYIFPHRNGLGSVDVIITQGGSGTGRDPGSSKRAAVAAYLETQRVAGDSGVRVQRPSMMNNGINVVVTAMPAVANAFDWSLFGGSLSLVSATTTTLTCATLTLPADLVAAVTALKRPRIQVSLPTATPLPVMRRILSSAVNGNNTVFTLDSALPATPANGDPVYPGGGAVLPVALAVLAYIDQVGPSQQSGFQDTVFDEWEAVVSVGNIARAALDAQDAGGRRVLVYAPQVGAGAGVQVGLGNGALGPNDILLYDNVPNAGPELPFARSILVLEA